MFRNYSQCQKELPYLWKKILQNMLVLKLCNIAKVLCKTRLKINK